MRRTALAITALALAASLWSPSVADAQRRRRQRADQPSAEARDAARTAYARGQQLFNEGDFEGAEAAFLEAFDAVPNPVVLLGVAESRERQGNAPGAVEVLERYVAERSDAPDREQVLARIQAMRAAPATLSITSEPPGASIRLDGEEREERTPAEIEVPPGEHAVVLSLEAHEDASEAVEATFGTRYEVELTLAESAPSDEDDIFGPDDGDEEELADEAPVDESDPGLPAGVWVASAISGAALVTGTVLGFLALSEQSDFDETPSEASADDGERLALFADVAFGVAAAAGITAIVLYLTADDPIEDEEDGSESTASLDLSPTIAPEALGVRARLVF